MVKKFQTGSKSDKKDNTRTSVSLQRGMVYMKYEHRSIFPVLNMNVNINSQSNRHWCSDNPYTSHKLLNANFKLKCGVKRAHPNSEHLVPLSKTRNSDQYVLLGINRREKWNNSFIGSTEKQFLKSNLLTLQYQSVCPQIFWEDPRPTQKWRSVLKRLSYKLRYAEMQGCLWTSVEQTDS